MSHLITFKAECAVDHPKYEALNLECRQRLPFVPRKGDRIAPGPHDDAWPVDEVFYSKAEGIVVFLVNDDESSDNDANTRAMLARHWREEKVG